MAKKKTVKKKKTIKLKTILTVSRKPNGGLLIQGLGITGAEMIDIAMDLSTQIGEGLGFRHV